MYLSNQKKQVNSNRPPSENEIKKLIFGKKKDDEEDFNIKYGDDKKIIALIASDDEGGSGSGSDEEEEQKETTKQEKVDQVEQIHKDSDNEDDEEKQKKKEEEDEEESEEVVEDEATKKKGLTKRLKELLATQNAILDAQTITKTGGNTNLVDKTKIATITATAAAAQNNGNKNLTLTKNLTDQKNPTSTQKDGTQTYTNTGMTTTTAFTHADRLSRMEKWDQVDKNHPCNQKFLPLKDFKGIAESRKCTNILWLLVWIILNGLFFVAASFGFKYGEPNRLSNGNDFRGDICGIGVLSDRAYQYFAAATVDISVSICVSSCPSTTGQDICLYNINGIIYPNEWSSFCYQQLASDYLGRYCMPQEPLNRQSVEAYLSTARNTVKRLSSDLNLTLDLLFLGLFFGILLSFSLQLIMRKEKRVPILIWGCIWGSFLCFGTMSALFYLEYKRLINFNCLLDIDKHSCGGSRAYIFYNLYWMTLVVAGIYLLVVINLFNRINLAIGFLKASSQVVSVLNQLNKIPFMSVVFSIVVGVITIFACIYALTIGSIKLIATESGAIENDRAKIVEYNNYAVYLILFLFYMFYNWQNFTLGVNNMITSFALCIWFFAKKKETVQIPLAITLKRIFRYHIGTVALYILIEPIFRIPRLLMQLVNTIFLALPQQSQFVRYIQGCFSCCLNFNGGFLRYISLHSFVQTSLFGDGYGTASKKAFFLINRHREKLKDLDFLLSFMIFQIKLCCSLFIAVMIYIIIGQTSTSPFLQSDLTQVETPILPAGVVFIICYQISDIFQGSYHMACKTIIQCYFIDKEMFVGEQRFVEKFIRDFMEFYAKEDLTTFKLKSQKQAVITQKLKNRDITEAIKKNYYNEFEADHKKEEEKKKKEEEDKKSDQDKSDEKESDESDSYVMEEDENQNNSDDSDGLNIGKRDPKKNIIDQTRTQAPKNSRPVGGGASNMFINDNASFNGDLPLRRLDETDMRSSGMSFFNGDKTMNRNDQTQLLDQTRIKTPNERIGTGNSQQTKVIDLSRGIGTAQRSANLRKKLFAKQM